MISKGGSYIKKNGKLELVEQTKWPEEKDALVDNASATADVDAASAPGKGGGKSNPGNKEA